MKRWINPRILRGLAWAWLLCAPLSLGAQQEEVGLYTLRRMGMVDLPGEFVWGDTLVTISPGYLHLDPQGRVQGSLRVQMRVKGAAPHLRDLGVEGRYTRVQPSQVQFFLTLREGREVMPLPPLIARWKGDKLFFALPAGMQQWSPVIWERAGS